MIPLEKQGWQDAFLVAVPSEKDICLKMSPFHVCRGDCGGSQKNVGIFTSLEKWFQNWKFLRLYYGLCVWTVQEAAVMTGIRQEYFVRSGFTEWPEMAVCIGKHGN